MTSKERMLTAMWNKKPDMVPVAPDISNMIPCKLTGKPFWDIYLYNDPPLWLAYINAVRYFKFDGWFTYGQIKFCYKNDERAFNRKIISKTDERIIEVITCSTPKGDLWMERTYYIADPPTDTRKWIKDIKQDFPKLEYFFPEIVGYDDEVFKEQRKLLGDDGAFGVSIGVPGIHDLHGWFDGGAPSAIYAYYDNYDLIKEFIEMEEKFLLRKLEMILNAKPDWVLIGASGMLTLSNPEIIMDITLPTMKKMTKMCKEAGIPSMLHSCGKERWLVELYANETDLNAINPLETPPMGDCNLKEIKEKFGKKIALMGNINTSWLLTATPEEVELVCKQAIEDAGENGGFILSTGDQVGRDTPFENIFAFISTARKYERY